MIVLFGGGYMEVKDYLPKKIRDKVENIVVEFNSNQEDFKERIERYNSGKLS